MITEYIGQSIIILHERTIGDNLMEPLGHGSCFKKSLKLRGNYENANLGGMD